MIREERDPAFWVGIASHPACAGAVHGGEPADIAKIASMPSVTPLASDNGGFFFSPLDWLQTTYEFHAIYAPEGWGKEVHGALKEALEAFTWQVIVTYQTANPHSQPPRSFGFRPAGSKSSPLGDITVWTLTRPLWEASKAYRSRPCRH